MVAEPDPTKAALLQPLLKRLADLQIPHYLFVNKIDKAQGQVRDLLAALQPASARPLVLRQVPIWKDGIVTGFVDLALERAFVYREHAASEVVAMPSDMKDREHEARYQMLEKLADYDDHLMEELLSDVEPPRDEVFADLSRELGGRVDRAGAAGLGRRRQRRAPLAEGASARGAGCFALLRSGKGLRATAATIRCCKS